MTLGVQTGSGKTLAFLLPMYRHVLDQPPLEPGEGPIAVIMAPTRELTVQIYNVCIALHCIACPTVGLEETACVVHGRAASRA
jgi:superfamily II DNA/RNA helicase